MENDDFEWELSKENVQPLKQGRHMSALNAALHSEQGYGDESVVIKTQQNEFEMELRTYSGDDPLDVWDRYIKWTEQYYPKGGHEGQLMKLIEQCLKLFQNEPKYANDQRFIQVWLKFASLTDDPAEVFSYMFDIGIGSAVVQVFMEWATALEKKGDLKRADAIYLEGLNRCTQSRDALKQSHMQFQYRVAQNITLQASENRAPTVLSVEEKEKRSALSRLKTHGNRSKVGVARTGIARLGVAGTLRNGQTAPPKQTPSKKFSIFCDEKPLSSTLQPQQTDEWQSLPEKHITNRENEKKPGVWSGMKMKQKPGSMVSASQPAPFEIHEDRCENPQNHAPRTEMINNQPLSSWKETSNPHVLDSIRQPNPHFNPNTGTPMYQKDKIYNGIMEFSFEELRASRYWKRRGEREERKREEERKLREERVQKQLEEQQAKIAALEAALLQTRLAGVPGATGLSEVKHTGSFSTPSDQVLHSSGLGISSGGSAQSNSSLMMNSGTLKSFPPPPGSQLSNSQAFSLDASVSRERIYISPQQPPEQMSSTPMMEAGNSCPEHLPKSKLPPLSSSVTEITPNNISGSGGGPNLFTPASFCTGDGMVSSSSSVSRELGGVGGPRPHQQLQDQPSSTTPSSADPALKSFNMERGLISAPSPTVHTKEAYQDIFGMFNTTFNTTDSFTGPTANSKTPSKSLEVPAQKERGDFQIYEDVMHTESPAAPKSGFFIHEDAAEASDVGKGDENVNMSRGSASSRKKGVVHNTEMGFGIHQDENASAKPQLHTKESDMDHDGFKIWYNELQDENSCPKPKPMKQNIRRGLAFSSTPGAMCQRSDCVSSDEVETLPDMSHYTEFTIEYRAKHEETLAPLDHYTIHARAASTPFTGKQDRSPDPPNQPQETSNLLTGSASSTSASITGSLASTLGVMNATPNKNDLSPIMEGSNEGSNDDMKSLHSTAASSSNVMLRSRHGSTHSQGPDPVQEIVDDSNVSMHDEEQQRLQQEESLHFKVNGNLDQSCHHEIDTTAYIPEDEMDQGTQALLSASIRIDPKDPFDDATVDHFLAQLDPPIQDYPNYERCKEPLPECDNGYPFNNFLALDKCIGEGGYAKVWKVFKMPDFLGDGTFSGDCQQDKALKVQKSGGQWEFYITSTLLHRLQQLNRPVDVTSAFLTVDKAYFFDDGSALEMDYMPGGSILDLVNKFRPEPALRDRIEPFACLLTIQLLHLFEQMHACHLIHGDVKPDNFLLAGILDDPDKCCDFRRPLVKLIDFGQSIDMTMFPSGTTFTAKVETSGFQCIEMKTNRPWTYQIDLFGIAGTIHVVLFGSYMKVYQEHGEWRTTGCFARKWNTPLWKHLFKTLLNVPTCWQLPDLAALRQKFEDHFRENLATSYIAWVNSLHLLLNSS